MRVKNERAGEERTRAEESWEWESRRFSHRLFSHSAIVCKYLCEISGGFSFLVQPCRVWTLLLPYIPIPWMNEGRNEKSIWKEELERKISKNESSEKRRLRKRVGGRSKEKDRKKERKRRNRTRTLPKTLWCELAPVALAAVATFSSLLSNFSPFFLPRVFSQFSQIFILLLPSFLSFFSFLSVLSHSLSFWSVWMAAREKPLASESRERGSCFLFSLLSLSPLALSNYFKSTFSRTGLWGVRGKWKES